MARFKDREKVIQLRKKGKSYTEIRDVLGVGKSTLSAWLRSYPLSKQDMIRLRDKSPKRIESYRNTMRVKREKRLYAVLDRVRIDLSCMDNDAYLLAGFLLYWAEGGKTKPYTATVANTDPAILQFFLSWLEMLGWPRDKVKVRLQLYADMDAQKEIKYWSRVLNVSIKQFTTPYVKTSNRSDITHKSQFSHGTCNVIVDNRDLSEYVLQGIEVLRDTFKNVVHLPVSKRAVGYSGTRA